MLASLISSLMLEKLLGGCLVTRFLSKMPWVRRYCCYHEKPRKKSRFTPLVLNWGLSYSYFNDSNISGWKVYTVDGNILGRLYCSFLQGVASHPCHVIMFSTSRHRRCFHDHVYNQDGIPRTSCIFSCSSCSRTDNWLNQNCMQIGVKKV